MLATPGNFRPGAVAEAGAAAGRPMTPGFPLVLPSVQSVGRAGAWGLPGAAPRLQQEQPGLLHDPGGRELSPMGVWCSSRARGPGLCLSHSARSITVLGWEDEGGGLL